MHESDARKVALSMLELTEARCCGDDRANTSITASNEAAARARTARADILSESFAVDHVCTFELYRDHVCTSYLSLPFLDQSSLSEAFEV